MKAPYVLVSTTLMAAIGLFAYSNATRTPGEPSSAAVTRGDRRAVAELRSSATDGQQARETADAQTPETITAETVDRWAAESADPDRDKRAAAIIALAHAPKEQALPALRNVLDVGDPEPDRQLALRALHTLAIEQGDADGTIRDTLRYAIYHGDDDGVSQSAQGYLEDLESTLSE